MLEMMRNQKQDPTWTGKTSETKETTRYANSTPSLNTTFHLLSSLQFSYPGTRRGAEVPFPFAFVVVKNHQMCFYETEKPICIWTEDNTTRYRSELQPIVDKPFSVEERIPRIFPFLKIHLLMARKAFVKDLFRVEAAKGSTVPAKYPLPPWPAESDSTFANAPKKR